jgi:hypothetical protein
MEILLATAITERLVIQFYYKGHLRVVEPFTFGILKNGKLALSGYRIGGHSNSKELPNWRLYFIQDISQMQLTDTGASSSRTGYNSKILGC